VYLTEFQAAGQALAAGGLISGSSGNLSIRVKDRLIITRHGSTLSALSSEDLVETGIHRDDYSTPLASWELPVHRAIYIATHTLAIVHAHPPCAVTLSLLDGKPQLPDRIAIVGVSTRIVPGALAAEIAGELKKRSLTVVRGHGSFAISVTLAEACESTLKFEQDCAQICRENSIQIIQASE
jgi:L-fuculose-phosphate aldolase